MGLTIIVFVIIIKHCFLTVVIVMMSFLFMVSYDNFCIFRKVMMTFAFLEQL